MEIRDPLGKHRCLASLEEAFARLRGEGSVAIIPEVQSNLAFALPGARGIEEVAAFPGRIIRVRDTIATICRPAFGASRHIAGIILTVLRYDGECRAAMNIRFTEEIVQACLGLGYDVDSFNRAEEPREMKEKEGSSLEWGTNYCLSRRPTIPDIIFDRGDVGKEPMVRVLGKTPSNVTDKVIKIIHCLK
ncbi:MAG TPA: hypothetical protein DCG53_10520 [Syntrophus sp. (in: bacteria)]|nr:hypothetical protein [Syntrophus sp. (in: bacteria)]